MRTDPRPHSVDVEPNYLPLIEFDPPDLPWLFTPAASGPDDRLRPWCVLVVVDLGVVEPPRTEPGLPLPVLEVPGAAVAAPSCPTSRSPGRGRTPRWSRRTARIPVRRWPPGRR